MAEGEGVGCEAPRQGRCRACCVVRVFFVVRREEEEAAPSSRPSRQVRRRLPFLCTCLPTYGLPVPGFFSTLCGPRASTALLQFCTGLWCTAGRFGEGGHVSLNMSEHPCGVTQCRSLSRSSTSLVWVSWYGFVLSFWWFMLHLLRRYGFPREQYCFQASTWHTARDFHLLCRDIHPENNSHCFQAYVAHNS